MPGFVYAFFRGSMCVAVCVCQMYVFFEACVAWYVCGFMYLCVCQGACVIV